MGARLLVCRLMRLAFEDDADWLVEALEAERENAAAQRVCGSPREGESIGPGYPSGRLGLRFAPPSSSVNT